MLNFNDCEMLIKRGRNGMKKLENNTWLVRMDDDTFGVRLHGTYVVQVHRDGTYTLNSGGWQTVTTKDRINNYSPVRLHQHKYVWYVSNGVKFFDGMVVNSAGVPVEQAAVA